MFLVRRTGTPDPAIVSLSSRIAGEPIGALMAAALSSCIASNWTSTCLLDLFHVTFPPSASEASQTATNKRPPRETAGIGFRAGVGPSILINPLECFLGRR